MARLPSWMQPTDNWVRAFFPCALIFIAACMDRNYQTDLWHHLSRGRVLLEEGRLLNEDRFTYTVFGKPLQDVNWLWQGMFMGIYRVGGLSLVQVVNAIFLTGTLALLLAFCWRRSSPTIASGVALVTFLGLWQLLLIRPQTFSFLLFVLVLVALEGAHRRQWLLVFPPLLMAVWVNVHGGFPIGLVLIGCYLLASLVRWTAARADWLSRILPTEGEAPNTVVWPWGLCLGASILATLANPYGWLVYQYVLTTSSRAFGRRIDEWLPPGFDTLIGKMWVLSLLATIVLLAWSRRRPRVREVCLMCVFLPLACRSVRMVAWWLLILAPILSSQMASLWPDDPESEKDPQEAAGWQSAALCLLLVGGMVLSLPWLESYNPALLKPEKRHRLEHDLQAVADRLSSEASQGRVFTQLAWAEYLGWALYPRFTVFMDGRIEIIPDEVWQEYSAVTRGSASWEEILDGYQVDYLVLDEGGQNHDLAQLAQRSGHWKLIAREGPAMLFERQASGN